VQLIWLVALFAALAGSASAQLYANLATVSPTTTLQQNGLCYSDGRDLACNGAAGLLITSGTVYFPTISATNISTSALTVNGVAITGSASGDRIVSGTLSMLAISSTGYVSLSTAGTNWGYLSSGVNYLPNLKTTTLSATIISVTALQVVSQSTSPVTCNSGNSGTLRYNSPTTTLELCNGSGWQPMGVGIPAGTVSAFASTTCPTGWSEYTAARGRFLRGIDNGANLDPNGTRTPGSTQADAMQGHTHSWGSLGTARIHTPDINNGTAAGSGAASWGAVNNSIGSPASDGTNGTPRTSSETRPVNVAVTFCQFNGTSNGWNNPLSGGSTSAAGNTSEIQYNGGSGAFASSANFTYASGVVTVAGQLSATNISASMVQIGANGATCSVDTVGAIRRNPATNRLEICQ
jgi:hypothetical protein